MNDLAADEIELWGVGSNLKACCRANSNAAPTINPLDSSVDQSWLAPSSRIDDHAKMVANLRNKLSDKSVSKSSGPALREHKAVFDLPVPVIRPNPDTQWPMYSDEKTALAV